MKRFFSVFLILFAVSGTAYAADTQATRGTENAQKLRAEAQAKRDEIKEKIQELQAARAEERAEIKAELLVRVKERAKTRIDQIVAKYQKTKTRINKMPNISDDRKELLAVKIDTQIEAITTYKEKVDQAATVEEVRKVMADLKTQLRKSYNAVKEAVAAIHATHLENILTKLNTIMEKLEKNLTNLGEKATPEMTTLKEEAAAFLTTAKTKLAANDLEGAKSDIQSARKSMVKLAEKIKVATEGTTETETEREEE